VISAAYSSGAVFPGEVTRIDDVELAVGQPLVEELRVGGRHRPVMAAGDVLHRRPDAGQQVAQDRKSAGRQLSPAIRPYHTLITFK
jgi:hypothetical protein